MAHPPGGHPRQRQQYDQQQYFERPIRKFRGGGGHYWSQNQCFPFNRGGRADSPRCPTAYVPNPSRPSRPRHNQYQNQGGTTAHHHNHVHQVPQIPRKIIIPDILKTGWYDIVPKRLKCEGQELFRDEEISFEALASLKSHIDTRVALQALKQQAVESWADENGKLGQNLSSQAKQSLESVSGKMFQLIAVGGEYQTLPVKICGFITTKEDIGKLLISFVQENILPEKKQFLINYTIPRPQVISTLKGINLLSSTGTKICEMIEHSRENDAAYIFDKYWKGSLMGIFLPLDRGFINNELQLTMKNVDFMINFYTLPMNHRKRISSYWERIDYCKHVHAGKAHGLTVVDFVTCEASQNYELIYYRKGFVLDNATAHNFKPVLGKDLPGYPVNRGISYTANSSTPTATTPLKFFPTPTVPIPTIPTPTVPTPRVPTPGPKTVLISSSTESSEHESCLQLAVRTATKTRILKRPLPPKIGPLSLTEDMSFSLLTKRQKVEKDFTNIVPDRGTEQPMSHSSNHTSSVVIFEVEDTSDHESHVVFDYNHAKPVTLNAFT